MGIDLFGGNHVRRLHPSVIAVVSQLFVFLLVFFFLAICMLRTSDKPLFAHPKHIEGKP